MMNRRQSEAALRYADRRRREDEAPRLITEVPHLDSLRLELVEGRLDAPGSEGAHVRKVVVATAPALFEILCQDAACRDGGHDLTGVFLRALRAGTTRFQGEDSCRGQVGSAACRRTLRFVGLATYRP